MWLKTGSKNNEAQAAASEKKWSGTEPPVSKCKTQSNSKTMKDFPDSSPKNNRRLIRKKKENPKVSSLKFILTWAILFIVALIFVQQRIDYTRTEKKVRQLMIEKRGVITSILPLKLEERYLTRLSNIEKTARSKIYLRKPSAKQIIIITDKSPVEDP